MDLLSFRIRKSTNNTYEVGWKKFTTFCNEEKLQFHPESLPAEITHALLAYLAKAHARNEQYGTANNVLCAVVDAVKITHSVDLIADSPILRTARAAYQVRHVGAPKYDKVYDVDNLFNLINSWQDNQTLDLDKLRRKVIALMKLDLMARGDDLSKLLRHPKSIQTQHDGSIQFRYFGAKGNRKGQFSSWITIHPFPANPRICTVAALTEYLSRVGGLSAPDAPISSSIPLFTWLPNDDHPDNVDKPLSPKTINQIMLHTMREAGIDTTEYQAHSTRSAAITKCLYGGASTEHIMYQACISTKDTFLKHYAKAPLPIVIVQEPLSHILRKSFQ